MISGKLEKLKLNLYCLELPRACFHWQPQCGFVVSTRSIWNLDSVWQENPTDTHTTAISFILAFLLVFATRAHAHTHGPSTRVPRLVCAERSSVTFPRHIKEPPQWAKLWPPAQYASVRQREGVLLALSHLFWFYSRSPIAAANAELWVCCCTVATFLWSAGKLGERPPRNGVAISILCYILRSARTWTLRCQGRHMDKLTIHTYFNNVANVKM